MSYELLGITVLWTFLYGYVIVASIDFGAGFFNYYTSITGKGPIVHKVIDRYLSSLLNRLIYITPDFLYLLLGTILV